MTLRVGGAADPWTATVLVSALYFRSAPDAIQQGTSRQTGDTRKGTAAGGTAGRRASLILRDAASAKEMLTGHEHRWIQRDAHANGAGQMPRHVVRLGRNGRWKRHVRLDDYAIGRLRRRLGLALLEGPWSIGGAMMNAS